MIKEVKMDTLACDRCEAEAFAGDEVTAWSQMDHAWEMAQNNNWEKINGKHYCPDCYYVGDDDELEVKSDYNLFEMIALPVRSVDRDFKNPLIIVDDNGWTHSWAKDGSYEGGVEPKMPLEKYSLRRGDFVVVEWVHKNSTHFLTLGKKYQVEDVDINDDGYTCHFWIVDDNGKTRRYKHYNSQFRVATIKDLN